MAGVVCQRTRRQMNIGRVCYLVYVLGAVCAAMLTAIVTDSPTGVLIGALVFWQASIKFLLLPPLVTRIKRWPLSSARFLAQFAIVCSLASFDLLIVFSMLSCFPQLEMMASDVGVPFTSNLIAVLTSAMLGGCAIIILCWEDEKYRRVEKCISASDVPPSIRSTAELIEFCQTRELDTEAELISRKMLLLAERGYFSPAA